MFGENLEATCIRKWNTTFFNVSTKRWNNGVLKLFPNTLLFCQDQDTTCGSQKTDTEYKLELPFNIICNINKSSSSLIFPAITISTFKNDKYWFSSFTCRDDTLNFLEHFFYPYLVKIEKPDYVSFQEDDTQYSSTGKQFLKSVVDSKQCLATAGNRLVEQGDQIRRASSTMMDIHNDVSVASKLTRGLKSWLPRWRIPKSYESEDFCVIKKNDVPNLYSSNALYCNVSPNFTRSQTQCIVTITKENVSLFDNYQKILQHFKWSDISEVKIISMWEISIAQHHIGKPDRKCNIISVNMLSLLKELEKYLPNRMKCITPEIETAWTNLKDQRNKIGGRENSEQLTLSPHDEEDNFDNVHHQYHNVPSDQEMRSLSNELTGLKSLALEIQNVEDKQLKEIGELTSAVTKETDRLSKLNKTLKRL